MHKKKRGRKGKKKGDGLLICFGGRVGGPDLWTWGKKKKKEKRKKKTNRWFSPVRKRMKGVVARVGSEKGRKGTLLPASGLNREERRELGKNRGGGEKGGKGSIFVISLSSSKSEGEKIEAQPDHRLCLEREKGEEKEKSWPRLYHLYTSSREKRIK